MLSDNEVEKNLSGGKKIFSVRFYLYTLSFCTHIYYTNKLQILNLDPTRAKYKFSVISLFTLIRSFTVPRLGRRKKKKMKMNQRKRGGVT
jgi:histone deacetylase complex regulatory component SIN3